MEIPVSMQLRIFYDGRCPLCVAEMRQLASLDANSQLALEDISAADFSTRFPHVDVAEANRILQGELPDGRLIHGLDVTCLAWRVVGKGHRVAFLRWPLIRPVADMTYRIFARYRYGISRLLTGKPRCDGPCSLTSPDNQG